MRSMGVAVPTAAAMLGHSEEVNKRYYTYDVADIQDKAKIISAVNQKQNVVELRCYFMCYLDNYTPEKRLK